MPRSLRSLCLLALTLSAFACGGSAADQAVDETVAFAATMPYALAPSGTNAVVVKDSALDRYAKVFTYFDPKDSTRASVYSGLPSTLLATLPATSVERLGHDVRIGDTTLVRVRIMRPEHGHFEEQTSTLLYGDSIPVPIRRDALQSFLTRAPHELQEPDTVTFYVLAGPRIVGIQSARVQRDAVIAKAAAAAFRDTLRRLVNDVRFEDAVVADYSALGIDAGGSIKGMALPGDSGWPSQEQIRSALGIGLEVECEARRGTDGVVERYYLTASDMIVQHGGHSFLCLWSGEEGTRWQHVRPTTFRVRVIGIPSYRDTVAGPWRDVPRR